MFLNRYFQNIVVVITCLFLVTGIDGCKKNNGGNRESSQPNQKNISAFTLDYENPDQLQTIKSELFLGHIAVKRYHIGQDQPTLYYAKDISKIVMYNIMHPDTKEWSLMKIDIFLKDGSVRSEHPIKVWDLEFSLGGGKGSRPVSIEQRFLRKDAFLEQELKKETKER